MVEERAAMRWVSAELEEGLHRSLCQVATELGVHPHKLCAEYIRQGVLRDVQENTEFIPVEAKVWAAAQSIRAGARMRAMLVQIAFAHQQAPDEATSDLLNQLCEMAGIPIQEVLDEADDSSIVPLIQDSGSKLAQAMRFLADILDDNEEVPVSYIYSLGEQNGLKPSILKQAKHELKVRSVRKPTEWVWTFAKPSSD